MVIIQILLPRAARISDVLTRKGGRTGQSYPRTTGTTRRRIFKN